MRCTPTAHDPVKTGSGYHDSTRDSLKMSNVSTQGSSDSTFSATVDFSIQQHNYSGYSDKKIKIKIKKYDTHSMWSDKPDFDSKNNQV